MKAQQLRNALLQLAVQGKLTPQNPNDECVNVLLQKIKAEKEKLIKTKKIKPEKPLSEITDEEKPFDIPGSWAWVRLGDIGSYRKGPFGSSITKSMFVPKSDDTVKVYEQKNAIKKNHKLGDYYINKTYYEKKLKGFEVFAGDIIVSCAGTIGETYIMPDGMEKGIINQALMKMKMLECINISYYLMYFDYILKTTANDSSKGSAIKNIPPFEIFKSLLLPLPPREEQQRIVEKIEEIMHLIDQYEKLEIELSKLEADFPKNLKKSILQYAVQGKIVEQNKDDESANVLLEKIKSEKKQLIKDKKIKPEKPMPAITDEETSFDIPSNWEWVRIGEIFEVGTGMTPLKSENKYYDNGNIPWVTSSSTSNEFINCSDTYITEYALKDTTLKIYPKGTLIMAMYGQGKTRGQISQLNIDATINQACSALESIYKDEILIRYVKMFFKYNYDNSRKFAEGSAQPNLNLSKVKMTVIPLPPLAEQQRIVARVDELMTLCDVLADDKVLNKHIYTPKEEKVIEFKSQFIQQEEDNIENLEMVARAESISPETQNEIADTLKDIGF